METNPGLNGAAAVGPPLPDPITHCPSTLYCFEKGNANDGLDLCLYLGRVMSKALRITRMGTKRNVIGARTVVSFALADGIAL